MPLTDALAFLGGARHSEDVAADLSALKDDADWEELRDVALRAGFDVTVEALARAYALDWQMRWMRYADRSA